MGNRYEAERRPGFVNYYGRESGIARRLYSRKLRRQERRAVARGDDAMPRRRGTQGWLTH
jgi:hypothetical protein